MIVKELTLTNFRAYESAHFTFQPGVNLIAGWNGVGKSSVLDSLRISMSHALRTVSLSKAPPIQVKHSDIRAGTSLAEISATMSIGDIPVQFESKTYRDRYIVDRAGEVRQQTITQRDVYQTIPKTFRADDLGIVPFALYFGPHRSIYAKSIGVRDAVHGLDALYHKALVERPAHLNMFADWLRTIEDRPEVCDQIGQVLNDFLPMLGASAGTEREKPVLYVRKAIEGSDHSAILTGNQLSDGERGLLALVSDLARRLVIANPLLKYPIKEGIACVLIDEIELHLHPQLQRDTMDQLAGTFKNCQFIITTHSPQALGEVSANRVHILESGQIHRPEQTLGMDSAWILRHVMDASDRSDEYIEELAQVSQKINEKDPQGALNLIEEIEGNIGPFDRLQSLRSKAELMLRLMRK